MIQILGDLVALSAPSLASLAAELAQSCLRLAATLQAAGDADAAQELELRAEAVLRGPGPKRKRPKLVSIKGGPDDALTPPRRPALTLVATPPVATVTSPTA